MVTSPVCSELRDRAARAACESWQDVWVPPESDEWLAVADAVAEVLAAHPGHWLGQRSIMDMEHRMLQERIERVEADLAHARFVMSQIAEQGCDRFTEPGDLTCIEETQAVAFCGTCIAQQFLSGPAGAAQRVGDPVPIPLSPEPPRDRVVEAVHQSGSVISRWAWDEEVESWSMFGYKGTAHWSQLVSGAIAVGFSLRHVAAESGERS